MFAFNRFFFSIPHDVNSNYYFRNNKVKQIWDKYWMSILMSTLETTTLQVVMKSFHEKECMVT